MSASCTPVKSIHYPVVIRLVPYTLVQDECPSETTLEEVRSSGDTRSVLWSVGNQKIQVRQFKPTVYCFDYFFSEVGVHFLAWFSTPICASVIHYSTLHISHMVMYYMY